MAHAIESDKFFCVGEKAWHGIGQVLQTAPDCAKAHELTGNHGIFATNVYGGEDNSEHILAAGYKAITRDDGKILSVMSDRYGIVQPSDFWDNLQPFLDTGLCEIESGGVLNEGSKMFGTLKVKDAIRDVLPGDPIRQYIRQVIAWDGTSSYVLGDNATRIVCANTLYSAEQEGKNLLFKVRCTKNMQDRIDIARQSILMVLENLNNSVEAYKALAAKQQTKQQQIAYVHQVLEFDPKDKDNSPQAVNKAAEVVRLIDTQRGLEKVPAMRGTAWQSYNAITDYLSHSYGHNADSRLTANIFGEAARINKRALNMALTC